MAVGAEQQEVNGQGAAGAAGGAGAGGTNVEPARVIGTASRAPIFQQPEGTQQEPGAAPAGAEPTGTQGAPKGRGPITTTGIPADALKTRLDRARAQGQEVFFKELGVKSEAEAREKLARLKTAEQEAEKRRLSELSEVERLKAELEAERQKNAALEAQLAEHAQEREHAQHEQTVVRAAGELIDPDALPLFRMHLAQHVKKLAETNPELAERFGSKGVERFAKKWVEKHPKFAKQVTTTTTAQPEGAKPTTTPTRSAPPAPGARPPQPVVRRPVTTGAPQQKNPAPRVTTTQGAPVTANGKTARPGQPNSMTGPEVARFAAENGIHYRPI